MLLDEGADNTSTDLVSGRTALDWAVLIGHESLLNTLLVHSDVCSTEKDLMVLLTNIYYLVRTNADNEVQTLLQNESSLQLRRLKHLLLPYVPTNRGFAMIVQYFLTMGADIEAREPGG